MNSIEFLEFTRINFSHPLWKSHTLSRPFLFQELLLLLYGILHHRCPPYSVQETPVETSMKLNK